MAHGTRRDGKAQEKSVAKVKQSSVKTNGRKIVKKKGAAEEDLANGDLNLHGDLENEGTLVGPNGTGGEESMIVEDAEATVSVGKYETEGGSSGLVGATEVKVETEPDTSKNDHLSAAKTNHSSDNTSNKENSKNLANKALLGTDLFEKYNVKPPTNPYARSKESATKKNNTSHFVVRAIKPRIQKDDGSECFSDEHNALMFWLRNPSQPTRSVWADKLFRDAVTKGAPFIEGCHISRFYYSLFENGRLVKNDRDYAFRVYVMWLTLPEDEKSILDLAYELINDLAERMNNSVDMDSNKVELLKCNVMYNPEQRIIDVIGEEGACELYRRMNKDVDRLADYCERFPETLEAFFHKGRLSKAAVHLLRAPHCYLNEDNSFFESESARAADDDSKNESA